MPVNWTIAGQTGKPFNATARSFSTAAIDSAKLEFKSLEPDTLTFTITPKSLTSATIPELRQEMILYRDGVQFFVGHVTDVRTMINSGMQQSQITVSGPWWWLEKIPFTSTIKDGTSATAERISYVFGTASAGQNLKTSIEAAINRSAALGAPIATIAQGSSIDSMFSVPRITLNQSTCGQVISELVRICPDAMVWFDYSTKPVRIKVDRRGATATSSLNVNTSPITSIDINPVIDLEVSNVVLPYVDRDTRGRTRFQVQTAGTNVTRKRQIITVSGPELDTFLPNDLFDSYNIKTLPTGASSYAVYVHDKDSVLVSAAKKAGLRYIPVSIEGGGTYSVNSSTGIAPITYRRTVPGATLKLQDNTSVSTASNYIITSGSSVPYWVSSELGLTVREATYSGLLRWYETISYSASGYYYDCGFDSSLSLSGYANVFGVVKKVYIGWKAFSIPVTIISTQYSTSTTLYRPADYSFIAPPADLAANLLAAQNWIPYEGSIQLEQEDVGGTRYRGTKVNISNSLPAFSTMGALVSGESLEIESGRTTINLGAPARNDYRTLVDKIRKTSQDNIVYV